MSGPVSSPGPVLSLLNSQAEGVSSQNPHAQAANGAGLGLPPQQQPPQGQVVSARLIPKPLPGPNPNGPGAYGTLTIGGKSYQVFHYRDNQQMGHTDEDWAVIADQVRDLLTPIIDTTHGHEIDISNRGVSYLSTNAEGKRTKIRINGADDKIVVQLMGNVAQMHAARVAHADRNTVHGSFSQGNSPYGRGLGSAACTGIDLQFAEMALLGALSNAPIDLDLIDEAVFRGQMKIKHRRLALMVAHGVAQNEVQAEEAYGRMSPQDRRRSEAYFAFDDDANIRLRDYHAGLCQAPLLNPAAGQAPYAIRGGLIPEQNTAEFYRTKLSQLLDPATSGVPDTVPVIFAGFTHDGESIGVLVYRDPGNPRAASKVVYFDSHGHALNGGRACAKTFDSQNAIQDAADFLSLRMPYTAPPVQQDGQPLRENPNQLQITPFHLHPFFYATDANRAQLYNDMAAQRDAPNLEAAICWVAVDPQQNESTANRLIRGREAITQAADRAAFLRERATPAPIRNALHGRDGALWPFAAGV